MADFSCYVTIVNNTNATITLQGKPKDTHGEYITNPATSIPVGSSGNFQLQQVNVLSPGPVGSCNYSVQDNQGETGVLEFSYACPITEVNAANAVFVNGNPAVKIQMIPNPLPQYGHPINVQFTVSN